MKHCLCAALMFALAFSLSACRDDSVNQPPPTAFDQSVEGPPAVTVMAPNPRLVEDQSRVRPLVSAASAGGAEANAVPPAPVGPPEAVRTVLGAALEAAESTNPDAMYGLFATPDATLLRAAAAYKDFDATKNSLVAQLATLGVDLSGEVGSRLGVTAAPPEPLWHPMEEFVDLNVGEMEFKQAGEAWQFTAGRNLYAVQTDGQAKLKIALPDPATLAAQAQGAAVILTVQQIFGEFENGKLTADNATDRINTVYNETTEQLQGVGLGS